MIPASEMPRDYRAVLAERRRRGQASAWAPLDFVFFPAAPTAHSPTAVRNTDGAFGAGAVQHGKR